MYWSSNGSYPPGLTVAIPTLKESDPGLELVNRQIHCIYERFEVHILPESKLQRVLTIELLHLILIVILVVIQVIFS